MGLWRPRTHKCVRGWLCVKNLTASVSDFYRGVGLNVTLAVVASVKSGIGGGDSSDN